MKVVSNSIFSCGAARCCNVTWHCQYSAAVPVVVVTVLWLFPCSTLGHTNCQLFELKVQFSLFTPWKHIRGSRGMALLILNLDTSWMWLVNIKTRVLYPQERTLVPIKDEAGWALQTVWTLWKRETSLASTLIWTPDRPTHRLVTVTTLLLLLSIIPSARKILIFSTL
jgi:hypothetical protein